MVWSSHGAVLFYTCRGLPASHLGTFDPEKSDERHFFFIYSLELKINLCRCHNSSRNSRKTHRKNTRIPFVVMYEHCGRDSALPLVILYGNGTKILTVFVCSQSCLLLYALFQHYSADFRIFYMLISRPPGLPNLTPGLMSHRFKFVDIFESYRLIRGLERIAESILYLSVTPLWHDR
jgi:hypothetical protein